MPKDMIMIAQYKGNDWNHVERDIKHDLKNVGISAQVLVRSRRLRIRFKSSEDLHMAVLSGILHPCKTSHREMKGYGYVKQ